MEYQTKRKDRFLVHHEKNGNTILPLLYILVNVLTITSRSLSWRSRGSQIR